MSIHRRAAKRDASEDAIFGCLRKLGWSIEPHSAKDGPDAFVGKYGVTIPIECKTDNRPLSPGQKKWHALWRGGTVYILRNVEDAIAFDIVISVLYGKKP